MYDIFVVSSKFLEYQFCMMFFLDTFLLKIYFF